MHHEVKHRLILADFSNTINTAKRAAVLVKVAIGVPAPTTLGTKRFGKRSALVFFQMDPDKSAISTGSSRVLQGDTMGPALYCMLLFIVLSGPKRCMSQTVLNVGSEYSDT